MSREHHIGLEGMDYMLGELVYPAFAYSKTMEVALFFLVNVTNWVYGYVLTSVLLAAYGETVSQRRVFLFAFINCNVIQTLVVYVPYAFTHFQGLGSWMPYLTTPNPLSALIYFWLGIVILQLPKYRLVHMITVLYLFGLFLISASRTLNYLFFRQSTGPYNYLLDAFSTVASLLVNMAIYFAVVPVLRKKKIWMKLSDGLFVHSLPKEILGRFWLNCLAYAMVVLAQVVRAQDGYLMLTATVMMALSIVISIGRATLKSNTMDLQNKYIHVNLLTKTLEQFRGIKHDFNNVLSTYSGFLAIGELEELQTYHQKVLGTILPVGEQMDLNSKMEQNPALVGLVAQKIEQATATDVYLRVNLLCDLQRLHVDNISICRVLGNLLDNALEAALESEPKRAALLMEPKPGGNVLIVVSNATKDDVDLDIIATRGMTTKFGHSGLGLIQVRSILSKIPNATLRFEYYDHQFTAYLELCPIS